MYDEKFWLLISLALVSNVSPIYSQKIRILLLGDSITRGEGIPFLDSVLTGYRQAL